MAMLAALLGGAPGAGGPPPPGMGGGMPPGAPPGMGPGMGPGMDPMDQQGEMAAQASPWPMQPPPGMMRRRGR